MTGDIRLGMDYEEMLRIIDAKEHQRDAMESQMGARVESAVWVEFDLARDLVLRAMTALNVSATADSPYSGVNPKSDLQDSKT